MARRRGPGRWSEDQRDELGLGRFFDSQRWRRKCTVPAWCPKCSSGWDCGSFFEDRDEAEACYWDLRDELMADELLGNRPRSWWEYEAPRLCRHDPLCALPDRRALSAHSAKHEWLDRHDLLSAEERALSARTGPPPADAGRLDGDDG